MRACLTLAFILVHKVALDFAGKCVHRISLSFDAFKSHEFAGKCVRGIGLSFDACLFISLLCHVNSRENAYTGLVIRLKLDLLIGLGR